MAEVSDEEQLWIARSQHGESEAFEGLVRRYYAMIFALTYRMTGNQADAEDLAQETFITAHDLLAQFRGEAKFSSWLYRIAVNRTLNWRDRDRRRANAHERWAWEATADPPANSATGESLT